MSVSTLRTNQFKVNAIQFGILSPEQIQSMSVAEVFNEIPYNELRQPNCNGVNDFRMGTISRDSICATCRGSIEDCPGHFGHIQLAHRVYHVGLLTYTIKVLRAVCFNCSKVLIGRDKEGIDFQYLKSCKSAKAKFKYINENSMSKEGMVCDQKSGGCGYIQPKFTKQGIGIHIEFLDENFDISMDRKQTLYADKVYEVFKQISPEDLKKLGFNKHFGRPEWMLIKNMPVAPPCVRPSVQMSNSLRSEDDLTYAYHQIIKTNNLLKKMKEKGTSQSILNEIVTQLQFFVSTLKDNDICGQPKQRHKSGKQLKSIRARLKGKEGRIRGNLMGKRVDFSSRTVITPDPSLKLDQLGVPLEIALNLTFPETVTHYNIDKLKALCQTGPSNWPGAKFIRRQDGRLIDLHALRNKSDAHIDIGYQVERHIQDGDYVMFNRQPSLHKMSIMGHRVKILPYKTFRMNLSVTSPYNADFDGDEMNMHIPQSYETVAEIKELMLVPNQIINPQSNKPVMGIVQDSLLGCLRLTQRDTLVSREDLMNLTMWIEDLESFPSPVILKPQQLWTGKQIFSLILPRIQYTRYNEARGQKNWASEQDKNILIRDGQILCGQLSKAQVGSTGGGLVHIIWKEHGPEVCKQFLSQTQCVVNNWLIMHGFTVGVQDIIARDDIKQRIKLTLQKQLGKVQRIIQDAQIGNLKSQPGKSMIQSFEAKINQKLNDARDKSGNIALENLSSENRLRNMVQAGSKGNNINISQIMACVGQQNVEGKRIPFAFDRRTLPHFAKDDYGPESKGFVQNSYYLGLSPSELFFHAMGGREGLIDTAVKTAETGYISRRLMKALEDVMVKYDGTVRTSKELLVQLLYGEDGIQGEHIEDLSIDSIKMDNLQLQKTHYFLSEDVDSRKLKSVFLDPQMSECIHNEALVMKALHEEFQQILKDRSQLRESVFKLTGDDQVHIPINVNKLIQNAKRQFEIGNNAKTDLDPLYVVERVKATLNNLSTIPGLKNRECKLLVDANLDSTSLIKMYIRQVLSAKNTILNERLDRSSFEFVLGEIKARFEQSLVNPGEMVGSIAAQSMGEPATQMTLNTFHFAGVSSKNVTLGVPRLKEIINVSRSIKTPSLKVYLEDEFRKKEQVVTQVGGQIEFTTLANVVSNTQIYYDPDPKRTIVKADEELVALYNEFSQGDEGVSDEKTSPWVLRLEFDSEKMVQKDLTLTTIDKTINKTFLDQVSIMHSDDNSEHLVIRLRFHDLDEGDEETSAQQLGEVRDTLLHDFGIKGLQQISRVFFTKYMETEFCPVSGKLRVSDDNWLIETDGVALKQILTFDKVNYRRTVSNDNIEICAVLGIEAGRQSLINELRFVLNSYGIYVNYRHLATLTDVMTQRGKLMSIARHGINRIDSGALRKCSFEETVEILLEAAVFSEHDALTGITENIVTGQLAPMGTGCFSLALDSQMVVEKALNQKDHLGSAFDEADGLVPYLEASSCRTPMPESERIINDIFAQGAPDTPAGGMSVGMYTPGAFGFTPNVVSSPGCFYASPVHQSSPAYNGAASPIYGGYRGQVASPSYNPSGASPQYMPSKIGGGMTPRMAFGASPAYPQSVYLGNQVQSPVHLLASPRNQNSLQSPAYSPNSQLLARSPYNTPFS